MMRGAILCKKCQVTKDVSLRKRKNTDLGFPGGAVAKNPPANAGDTGSIPGQGRSHVPRSNKSRAPQLLSLRSRSHEPQLLKPMPRACALQKEKPPQ